jgi:hypothetical protein
VLGDQADGSAGLPIKLQVHRLEGGQDAHGNVVDLFGQHHAGWAFPLFDLADSAITLGAVCLIFDEIRRARRCR